MSRRWPASATGTAVQWIGVLTGPLALAADQLTSYALVKWTCGHQHLWVLHAISLAALIVIAGGAFAAWTAVSESPPDATLDGGRSIDRGRFMRVLGLATSALFAALVVAMAVPGWMIDACL